MNRTIMHRSSPCSPPPSSPPRRSAEPAQDVADAPVAARQRHVISDVVRIGDVIDNAGTAAQIAIYRAPDLGTTGTLPTAQLIEALRAHQVIGVDTHNIKRSRGHARVAHAARPRTSSSRWRRRSSAAAASATPPICR